MKKVFLFYFFQLLFTWQFSRAQVGIGTVSPDASSILDLTTTSKGMLAPRMTQAQKLAISSPATGLLIFQTDATAGFWYYTGSVWVPLLSNTMGWSTLGNTGTVAGTNFIGTTDAIDFVTKTNSAEVMRVTSGGNVGMGTTAPGSKLDVKGTIRLSGSTSGYVGLAPAAVAGSTTYTLPSADGTSGQQLSTNGSGVLSWSNQTGTTSNTISSAANIITSNVNGTSDTALAVNSVSNTSSTNSLTTTVNGVAGAAVNIINSNASSLSGANLTTTVNGVASSALDLTPAIVSKAWSLTGNASTVAGTNFIGTTDAIDFVTKTNNAEKMRVTSAGNVGIGATAPGQKLETMNGNVLINNNNNTSGELRIGEPSTSGTNYSAFKTQAQAANVTYTLPAAQGAANMVLTNDGTGILSWTIGGIMSEFKGSDESVTNSTTLQDDNDFSFTLPANHVYEIAGFCRTTVNNTYSMKAAFVAPAGSTLLVVAFANRSAADDITYMTAINTGYEVTPGGAMGNTGDVLMFQGTITTAGTGGTFKMQWAQQSSGGTSTTIHAGSYMKLTLVQ